METSEKNMNVIKGFIETRHQIKQPSKNATNPFFKSKYVELEGVIKSVEDALPSSMTYAQDATTSENGEIAVYTIVFHESGEWLRFGPLCIKPAKNDAQAMGSAETYARRYALSAVFGIASDKDDDGNEATGNSKSKQARFQKAAQKKSNVIPATDKDKQELTSDIKSLATAYQSEPKEIMKKLMIGVGAASWGAMTKDNFTAMKNAAIEMAQQMSNTEKETAL